MSTFAHGYNIVCMQETHIRSEHCRPSIHGMKLIAETRHRKYDSAVYAKPTLNIEEVHIEVTDSQIELITVSLATITISSVYHPPASEFAWPSLPDRCRRLLNLVIGDFNSHITAWGYEQNDSNVELVEAWAEDSNFSLIHDAKLPSILTVFDGREDTTLLWHLFALGSLQCAREEYCTPSHVHNTVLSQSLSDRQSLPRITLSEDAST